MNFKYIMLRERSQSQNVHALYADEIKEQATIKWWKSGHWELLDWKGEKEFSEVKMIFCILFWLLVIWVSTFALLTMPKTFDCVDHNKLWKVLKEMGIPGYLTCLLRNQYAGHEATCMQVQLELDMEQQTGCKSGMKYVRAVYCHPTYLTYM